MKVEIKRNEILTMIGRFDNSVTNRLSGLILLIALVIPMDAAIAKVNTGSDGLAVHGYDVVAYFLEGRAVRGTSEFEHKWQDAKWHFSSAANKDLFAANPERYAPQYGGFCAVCLAIDGELADANPKAWTIVDGKLYLNYSMHQRTQWRIRSDPFVKLGDEGWAEVISREKKPATSDDSHRLAIMKPNYFFPGGTPNPQTVGELGSDFYKEIRQQSSFSIAYADEPSDPSALGFLNRGGDWPFPPTNVSPDEAWQGGIAEKKPNLERLFRAGRDLDVDALVMWFYKPRGIQLVQKYPVEVHVIDIEKQRVYSQKGSNYEVQALVRQAFGDFVAGREGYRTAVMKPAFYYPWGGVPEPHEFGPLGEGIYAAIQEQSSFSITHADEPTDPSARGYLSREGDWPFPSTKVSPEEAWQGSVDQQTPNLEQLYRVGQELGLDAVVMWFSKPDRKLPSSPGTEVLKYPIELFVIDIQQKRVYTNEGQNSEAAVLVRQSFSDFMAGR